MELNAGDREVVLKNLSKSLDKDSVRVDGIGPASITEVSFQVQNEQHNVLVSSYRNISLWLSYRR